MLVNVFFKEIKVIGTENIPKNETVIFCGNHANQFIDPCVFFDTCLVKRYIDDYVLLHARCGVLDRQEINVASSHRLVRS